MSHSFCRQGVSSEVHSTLPRRRLTGALTTSGPAMLHKISSSTKCLCAPSQPMSQAVLEQAGMAPSWALLIRCAPTKHDAAAVLSCPAACLPASYPLCSAMLHSVDLQHSLEVHSCGPTGSAVSESHLSAVSSSDMGRREACCWHVQTRLSMHQQQAIRDTGLAADCTSEGAGHHSCGTSARL